jgi:hypothetical protein
MSKVQDKPKVSSTQFILVVKRDYFNNCKGERSKVWPRFPAGRSTDGFFLLCLMFEFIVYRREESEKKSCYLDDRCSPMRFSFFVRHLENPCG